MKEILYSTPELCNISPVFTEQRCYLQNSPGSRSSCPFLSPFLLPSSRKPSPLPSNSEIPVFLSPASGNKWTRRNTLSSTLRVRRGYGQWKECAAAFSWGQQSCSAARCCPMELQQTGKLLPAASAKPGLGHPGTFCSLLGDAKWLLWV